MPGKALIGAHSLYPSIAKIGACILSSAVVIWGAYIFAFDLMQLPLTPVTLMGTLSVAMLLYLVSGWYAFRPVNESVFQEAREKARLLEAVIVGANDAVIITDAPQGDAALKILYVNEAFTSMTGYAPEEVIGKSPSMLQGPGTNKKTLKDLSEALKAKGAFKGELLNYHKNGSAYWLEISIVPVLDEMGRLTHYAAIERDITQRKAFEKELQINREAAEVANRAKGDFLANMSHELRTPMNGIIGLSDLLVEMNLGNDQHELAEAINSSSRNLLILLNDILDLSKIEANELTLERVPFDLRRVLRQTVDLLAPMASRKGIVLESTINPIVPERICGDPVRLQQIMNNLIGNALKFTEMGYVRLDMTSSKAQDGRQFIHIRVEDTGIGISDEAQEKIFHKFTQADVSTARKYGGTGLGLSITKQLVELMNGEISFNSVEGKGTTFYVDIPVEIAKKEEGIVDQAQKKGTIFLNTSANILVVDDHPVNLLFIRKVLKKLGFTNAQEASSGREALELCSKRKFDLIFMDCQMPEMDGFEASIAIRDMEKEDIGGIPIIAVTADAMKGAREKCIDAGMNDYISKPVDVEKLQTILAQWLPGGDVQGDEAGPQTQTAVQSHALDDSVVDWERLRMFTDDDPDEEEALIELFTTYAQESLAILACSLVEIEQSEWKKAAHKLKGSAANFGAAPLSEACLRAEAGFEAGEDEKQAMLSDIQDHYRAVCNALAARRQKAQVMA